MCTIIAAVPSGTDQPLIIAANRDELTARDALPPLAWDGGAFLAGRDLMHGGTWFGATASGFFVGITNQRTYNPGRRFPHSRGDLVAAMLRAGDTSAAKDIVSSVDPTSYGECNLMFGDHQGVNVAYLRHTTPGIVIEQVPPGLQVLPNDSLNSAEFAKVERTRTSLLSAAADSSAELGTRMRRCLADHQRDDLGTIENPPPGRVLSREFIRELTALCVHTPTYGTRSATYLEIDRHGLIEYAFADGPTCTTPFATVYAR